MKSLQSFQKDKSSYYNGINKFNSLPLNEAEHIVNNSLYLDSAFNKMRAYSKHNFGSIYESQDFNIYFTIKEQFALRDTFYLLINEYLKSLYIEENGINESLSIADVTKWANDKVKAVKDKVASGIDEMTKKIKDAKEFLSDIMSNSIKTVKDLLDKLTNMMIKVGCSVKEFFGKLGFDEDETQKEFESDLAAAIKDEGTLNQCQFESYATNLLEYGTIFEEEEVNDGESKEGDSKEGDDKKEKKPLKERIKNGYKATKNAIKNADWKTILKKSLLKMLVYYTITLFIPVAIGLVGGPVAAAVAECAGKLIWGTYKCWSILQREIKYQRSDEYKKMKKWRKAIHWLFFLISIGFTAYTAGVGGYEGITKVFKYFSDPEHFTLLPSEAVQSLMRAVNKIWEGMGGNQLNGIKLLDEMIAREKKIADEIANAMEHNSKADGKNAEAEAQQAKFQQQAQHEFKAGETNNQDWLKDTGGDKLTNRLNNELINKDGLTSSAKMLNQAENIQVETPGTTMFGIDGATLGKIGRTEYIKQIAKEMGVDPSDIQISQLSNVALRKATNSRAGTIFMVAIKKACTSDMVKNVATATKHVADAAGVSHGGWTHCFSIAQEVINKIPVPDMVQRLVTTFLPFGGIGDLWDPVAKDGKGFRVRLGKAGSNNFVYEIGEDGIKEMSVKDATSDLNKYNKGAFDQLKGIINDTNKKLQDYQKELNKDNKNQEDNSDIVDARIKQLEKAINDYKIIVLSGSRVKEDDKKESLDIAFGNYIFEAAKDPETSKKVISNFYNLYLSYFTPLAVYDITDEDVKKKLQEKLKSLRSEFEEKVNPLIDGDKFEYVKSDDDITIVAKNADDKDIYNLQRVITKVVHPDKWTELNDLITEIKKKYIVKDDKKNTVTKDKDGNTSVDVSKALPGKQQVKLLGLTDVPATIDDKDKAIAPVGTTALTVIPKETGLTTVPKKDDPKPAPTDTEDRDEGPVLFFSPIIMCGGDLNKADDKGPRKGIYYMNNLYESLEFIPIEGGASKDTIEKMLSDMIAESAKATYNIVADEPCVKDGKKYKVNDKSQYGDKQREDYGNFTNADITDIMNTPANAKNYLSGSGNSIAETEDEKKQLKKLKDIDKKEIENDDEAQEYIKKSKTLKGVIDDDGINKDELDKLTDSLSNYQLAKHKEKKKKGFFAKVISFFKRLFGSYDEDELDGLNSIISSKHKNTNESVDDELQQIWNNQ